MAEREQTWHRISGLLIAVVVGVGTWAVTYITENAKTNLQYVELAVGILQADSKADRALREWAVELIQESAPVRLSDAAATSLIEGRANLPAEWVYDPEQKRIRRAPGDNE